MHKYLALLFLSILASLNGQAQSEKPGGKGQALLWLDAKSELIIHVSTNVNGFPCRYVSEDKSDVIFMDYEAIDRNYVTIDNAVLSFPLADFDCGQQIKNKEFREFLKEAVYPTIEIDLKGLEIYDRSEDGSLGRFVATVEVAAVQRKQDIQIVDISSDDSSSTYSGHVNINVRDYGLEPPVKFLGMVKVKEEVAIDFEFRFVGK